MSKDVNILGHFSVFFFICSFFPDLFFRFNKMSLSIRAFYLAVNHKNLLGLKIFIEPPRTLKTAPTTCK
jgi:hypothetical protein